MKTEGATEASKTYTLDGPEITTRCNGRASRRTRIVENQFTFKNNHFEKLERRKTRFTYHAQECGKALLFHTGT